MINKRLLALVPNTQKYISKAVFFQWLCLLCSISITISICLFINKCLIDNSVDLKFMTITVITILVAAILRAYFTKIQINTTTRLSQNAKKILRKLVFSRLSEIGQSYNLLVSTAEAVQVNVEGIEQLESYFGAYLPQLFYSALAPLTLFTVFSFLNIQAAIVLLICVPLIPISIIAVQKFAKKLFKKYWNEYTGLGDSFLENIQGLTALKIYEADEAKHKEMNEKAESFRKATMRVLIMQLNSISVMDIVAYGGAAAGTIYMLLCMKSGMVTFLEGIIIILLSSEFFIPMRQLGSFFHIAMNGAAAADKIFKILDTKIPLKGKYDLCENTKLKIDNLSFSYDNKKTILKKISLQTEEKGLFTFVGKSGCGKSTIASLLTGRLREFDGNIFIGGREIRNFSENGLANTVTLITHNSYIFKGTVESNLKMGKTKASKDEMTKVLKTADLLELSLDYTVLEQGANLSGGQRQRLALARALLHDTPIYIFDEATSNIDAESEDVIIKAVNELSKDKLVILISHRLANVINSDKIFVLENGEINESGTHEKLINNQKTYSKLYNHQMSFENFGKGVFKK